MDTPDTTQLADIAANITQCIYDKSLGADVLAHDSWERAVAAFMRALGPGTSL